MNLNDQKEGGVRRDRYTATAAGAGLCVTATSKATLAIAIDIVPGGVVVVVNVLQFGAEWKRRAQASRQAIPYSLSNVQNDLMTKFGSAWRVKLR